MDIDRGIRITPLFGGFTLLLIGVVLSLAACGQAAPSAEPSAEVSPSVTSPSTASTPARADSSAAAKKPSSPPACATADLTVGLKTPAGSGAAGSTYKLITFTNSSDHDCLLYGWSGVSYVGKGDGTPLGAAAERVAGDRRQSITLTPGSGISELLQLVNAGNFAHDECDPMEADGLRIYPPDNRSAAFVPLKIKVCSSDGPRQLFVSPVGVAG